jgi:hypothetical protein
VWREGGGEVAGGLVEVKSWPARYCQVALGYKRIGYRAQGTRLSMDAFSRHIFIVLRLVLRRLAGHANRVSGQPLSYIDSIKLAP